MDRPEDRPDECMCCHDEYRESQLDENGHCTMCASARATFAQDGIPAGRPCCRRYLSQVLKESQGG